MLLLHSGNVTMPKMGQGLRYTQTLVADSNEFQVGSVNRLEIHLMLHKQVQENGASSRLNSGKEHRTPLSTCVLNP